MTQAAAPEGLVDILTSIVNAVSYPVSTSINPRGWDERPIDDSGSEYIAEKAIAGLALLRQRPADEAAQAICDCERSANGLGLMGRECDCLPSPDATQPREQATAWQDIGSAPRDGRLVWLWNKNAKHPADAPQRFYWSTHYSVFGLGGCWTDGHATMGDKVDFDFWCEALPADFVNPHEPSAALAASRSEGDE